MRMQGAKVYLKFEDILAQDGIRWTDGERTKRTARSVCEPDSIQYNALANEVELSSADLQMLGKGLINIVGWLMELPMEPWAIDLWTRKDVLKLSQDQEYRLAICQYILELAQSILKGDADLEKDETDAHKLLVEWLLHQISEYLIRTNSEVCAESVSFTGPQLVGFKELWKLMGGLNSAGTQTLVRRMAIQFGELERLGCVRLDQVWNIPTTEAQNTAMDLPITKVQRDLCVTSGLWIEKAERLRGQVQKAQATNQEAYHKSQARRERSPSEESTEVVKLGPREKGKQVIGKRESKRAKAEEVETPPDLMEVSPKGW
jgi:hypothetical protein